MKTVDEILAEELAKPGARLSPEYKAGLRAGLEWRRDGKEPFFPYPCATAQADAFFFGLMDGHKIWRLQTIRTEEGNGE